MDNKEFDAKKSRLRPATKKMLEEYSLPEQKQWVANPFIENLLRNYTNKLKTNLTPGSGKIIKKGDTSGKINNESNGESNGGGNGGCDGGCNAETNNWNNSIWGRQW